MQICVCVCQCVCVCVNFALRGVSCARRGGWVANLVALVLSDRISLFLQSVSHSVNDRFHYYVTTQYSLCHLCRFHLVGADPLVGHSASRGVAVQSSRPAKSDVQWFAWTRDRETGYRERETKKENERKREETRGTRVG